ncbi:dTDP-4-dehydrorhamnose 3,5-epimerase family protein [Streptosporangium sandarakinum]|uniref:dTDP-4-dehydrorhamnose 3,5-epimerase n=1 Tax=Streptosporangium sandarakinum TaxID=1260955 RepID=A0A852V2Z0_9ACTN|nr:dTDP-4-dehydrorhamnose 3,5-epimerase [Streptosporangium sandarakinum]NYF41594.1 dTDP-4-dehydrorhamnose 3,5-epimerase [Streptosporangium sandarakinum]
MAVRDVHTRSMHVRQMAVPGAFLVTAERFDDERGTFYEAYREDVLAEALGHPPKVVQTNFSVSHRGVLRGIHGAVVPPGLAKLVTCVRGAVLDAVVDLRAGSPTFGRYEVTVLDHRSRACVYLSEGLGHAFLALEDDTCVQYQCSETYRPRDVITVNPLDPEIGLPFRTPEPPILSPGDAAAPTLREALERGLLPSYQDCLDHHRAPAAGW